MERRGLVVRHGQKMTSPQKLIRLEECEKKTAAKYRTVCAGHVKGSPRVV